MKTYDQLYTQRKRIERKILEKERKKMIGVWLWSDQERLITKRTDFLIKKIFRIYIRLYTRLINEKN